MRWRTGRAQLPHPALLCVLLLPWLARGAAPDGALTHKELEQQLKSIVRQHKEWMQLGSLATSRDGHDVWLLTLGSREKDAPPRPSLLLVAGIEGDDILGTASALHWVRHLAAGADTNQVIKEILSRHTLYIVPRANPDAAAAYLKSPIRESSRNLRPVDDDHDGALDEDGPDDLDGDGVITMMRIQDPEGEYIPDPLDDRLLLKADPIKGESGAWKWMSEGRDDDGDERWNEDGPGGVNLNRNFPYQFAYFASDSGLHQMSEPVTRALAEFVVSHPEIAVVFTFGVPDNLTQTPKGEPGGKRPPGEIDNDDLPFLGFLGELGKAWRDALGLKKEVNGAREPGSFSDWIYFHRGRLSLAARPWSPALQLALPKATPDKEEEAPDKEEPAEETKKEGAAGDTSGEKSKDPDKPSEDGKDTSKDDNRNKEEREFLAWLLKETPERWVPWKPLDHPDFPGQKVEVGGYVPYARICPPASVATHLYEAHARFLTDLAGKLPRIGIRSTELKALGGGVYDLTVRVENTGYLPTSLAQGQTTREVFPTRVELKVEPEDMLAGDRRVLEGPIPGSGGMREVRWIFLGRERKGVGVSVHSMLGDSVTQVIDLKEEQP